MRHHLRLGDQVTVSFRKPAFFDPQSGTIFTGERMKTDPTWKELKTLAGVFNGKDPNAKEETVRVMTTDLPYHHKSTSKRELTFPLPMRLVDVDPSQGN